MMRHILESRRYGSIVEILVGGPEPWKPGDLLRINREGVTKVYSLSQRDERGQWILVRDAGEMGQWLCSRQVGSALSAEIVEWMFHPVWDRAVWISFGTGAAPFMAAWPIRKPRWWYCFGRLDLFNGPAFLPDDERVQRIPSGQMTGKRWREAAVMSSSRFFLCGSGDKISFVSSLLIEAGIDPLRIESDVYGAAND